MKHVNNNIPLYVQVYNTLLEKITNNEFFDKLPSETEMVKLLNVSRTTLRQALLVLQEDRIIYKKRGSGTYINKKYKHQKGIGLEDYFSIPEYLTSQNLSYEICDLSITIEEADAITADLLHIQKGSTVFVIARNYKVDGEICGFAYDFISKEMMTKNLLNEINTNDDFLNLVEHKIPQAVSFAQTSIIATKAGDYLAKKMNIDKDYPIILLMQVLNDSSMEHLSLNKTYINTSVIDLNINRKK